MSTLTLWKPDLTASQINYYFLLTLSSSANWLATLHQVPVIGCNYVLTDNYGFLTYEKIRAHALSHVNTQTSNYENAYQIYEWLFATLTYDARTEVVATRFNE